MNFWLHCHKSWISQFVQTFGFLFLLTSILDSLDALNQELTRQPEIRIKDIQQKQNRGFTWFNTNWHSQGQHIRDGLISTWKASWSSLKITVWRSWCSVKEFESRKNSQNGQENLDENYCVAPSNHQLNYTKLKEDFAELPKWHVHTPRNRRKSLKKSVSIFCSSNLCEAIEAHPCR